MASGQFRSMVIGTIGITGPSAPEHVALESLIRREVALTQGQNMAESIV
jgi:hypothetical protein